MSQEVLEIPGTCRIVGSLARPLGYSADLLGRFAIEFFNILEMKAGNDRGRLSWSDGTKPSHRLPPLAREAIRALQARGFEVCSLSA